MFKFFGVRDGAIYYSDGTIGFSSDYVSPRALKWSLSLREVNERFPDETGAKSIKQLVQERDDAQKALDTAIQKLKDDLPEGVSLVTDEKIQKRVSYFWEPVNCTTDLSLNDIVKLDMEPESTPEGGLREACECIVCYFDETGDPFIRALDTSLSQELIDIGGMHKFFLVRREKES